VPHSLQLRRFITLIDALYEGRVLVCLHAESEVPRLLNVSEEEKWSTPFDEVDCLPRHSDLTFLSQVFAFDRTVSRLLEMQSQDYLRVQYSEWLQRRGSSKGLLTSLLQSERTSALLEAHPRDPSPLHPRLEDEPFLPQFQCETLTRESIRQTISEELKSTAPHRALTIERVVRRSIEKRTGVRLEEALAFSSSPLEVGSSSSSLDAAVQACHSSQSALVFLSADRSFRIATSSPSTRG
jgi:hypothetical protein